MNVIPREHEVELPTSETHQVGGVKVRVRVRLRGKGRGAEVRVKG